MTENHEPADHRKRPLEPHENATVRELIDSWLRAKWLRRLMTSIVAQVTAVLILVGLFREQIGAALAALFGGPKP